MKENEGEGRRMKENEGEGRRMKENEGEGRRMKEKEKYKAGNCLVEEHSKIL